MQTPFSCDGNLAVYGHAAGALHFGSRGLNFSSRSRILNGTNMFPPLSAFAFTLWRAMSEPLRNGRRIFQQCAELLRKFVSLLRSCAKEPGKRVTFILPLTVVNVTEKLRMLHRSPTSRRVSLRTLVLRHPFELSRTSKKNPPISPATNFGSRLAGRRV